MWLRKNHSKLHTTIKVILFTSTDFVTMADQKPLFKAPYDIKDVSALFAIVAFVLILAALLGNNLFGEFQQKINFGLIL